MSVGANYGAKQANKTAYVKTFVEGTPIPLWTVSNYKTSAGITEQVITTVSSSADNLYIPGDLFVDGNIQQPSDQALKRNIQALNYPDVVSRMQRLTPRSFQWNGDPTNRIHYGLIAQELELEFPELISSKPSKNRRVKPTKAINYMELVPLLVCQVQQLTQTVEALQRQVLELTPTPPS